MNRILSRLSTLAARSVSGIILLAVAMLGGLYLLIWLLPEFRGGSDMRRLWWGVTFYGRIFQMHVGIGVLAMAIFVLLLRHRRTAAVAMVVGLLLLKPSIQDVLPKPSTPLAGKTFRVLSFNVLIDNLQIDQIKAEITRWDPDVLVLVELGFAQQDKLFPWLSERYGFVFNPKRAHASVVVSRLPARVEKAFDQGTNRPRQPVVIEFEGREFAIYGVHLLSPSRQVGEAEEAFEAAIRGELGELQQTVSGAIGAAEVNRWQSELLELVASREWRPTIFAGDFNATIATPNVRAVRSAGMRTTHELAGFGAGTTWRPVNSKYGALPVPGIRIDHILVSPEFAVQSHQVGRPSGSDHAPIVADIGWARDQSSSTQVVSRPLEP
jgi:endonuclease/exonuclease/phosphatase (EEP) superfamily protein YafD